MEKFHPNINHPPSDSYKLQVFKSEVGAFDTSFECNEKVVFKIIEITNMKDIES